HGMRAAKHVVLPDEDAAEFAGLEAAMIAELAPVGTLQSVLARRVAIAAWRLARADRIEAEVFKVEDYGAAGAGLALIRDGNSTRSFETLLRYRGAAMAEFSRALHTLKALQAEQTKRVEDGARAAAASVGRRGSPARATLSDRPGPSEPELRMPWLGHAMPEGPALRRALQDSAALWLPNEPGTGPDRPLRPVVHAKGSADGSAGGRSEAQSPADPLASAGASS
ncbi:MAG TPA: hypothetical protein VLE23_02210, partial [Geminicoccaceae bacterium]|nr:hypothetical protein [Geminicoccaceae bacterium]